MAAQTYPLELPTIRLTVGGEDRTGELMARTLVCRKVLGSQVDTLDFSLTPPESWRGTSSGQPQQGAEVVFEVKTGSGSFEREFGGYIIRVNEVRTAFEKVHWAVSCVDYTALLNRIVVNETYVQMALSDIVLAVVRKYAPAIDVTSYVQTANTNIQRVTFARKYLSDVLTQLANLIGFDWYVDENKALHFYDPSDTSYVSALEVTDDSTNFMNLAIQPHIDQVRNRVYVEGGTAVSSPVVEQWDANGILTSFPLENENVVAQFLVSGQLNERFMVMNGVPQRVGLQGQVDEANFAGGFLLDPERGIVRCAAGTDTPEDGARIIFTYQFLLPIAVVREDLDSQNAIAELTGEDYGTTVENKAPLYWWRMVSEQGTTIEGNQGSTGYGSVGGGAIQRAGGLVQRRATGALNDKSDGGNWAANFQNAHYYCGSGIRIPQNAYTLEAWVQPDPQYRNRGILGAWANDGGNHNGAMLWFSSSGTYAAVHGTNPNTWIVGHAAQQPTGGGQYDHVVSAWDGATLTLYVNNQPLSRAVASAPGIVANSGILIGHYYGNIGGVTGDNGFVGSIDECAVYVSGLSSAQVGQNYAAGRMAGVREAIVVDNTLTSLAQARRVGDGQLDRYATVITDVGWSSYVPGWAVGESVPVNVTYSGLGRTNFAASAKIQELMIRAIGAQRLLYDVRCQSVRFNRIDYERLLARQRDVVGDVAPLSLVRYDQAHGLVIPANASTSTLTPPFLVQPDWGAASPPPIKVGFWEVDADWG